MAIYKPGSGFSLDTEYAGTFILDFAASRTVRNKFLLLTTHPIYDIQFIAPQTDLVNAYLPSHSLSFLWNYWKMDSSKTIEQIDINVYWVLTMHFPNRFTSITHLLYT